MLATEISEELHADRDAVLADLVSITAHLAEEGVVDGLGPDGAETKS